MQTSFTIIRDDGMIYNLKENGGYMAYKPEIELPILDIERKAVLGKGSPLTYNLEKYRDRSIVVPVFFMDWDSVKKFNKFFNGNRGKLYFNYKKGYYKIVEVNSIFERDAKGLPEIDINLTIEPFMFLEDINMTFTQNTNVFTNFSDAASKCILKIYGTGDVSVSVNNQTYDIYGLDGYIVLNSDTLQILKDTTNENKKVIGNLSSLKIVSGENIIRKTGNITKIELNYIPIIFE